MCGIFGFSLKRRLISSDVKNGLGQLTRLSHRGPDGQGQAVFNEQGVFIGHRRLAILDVSDSAAQPMTRHGLTLAHNGEIYNFIEIRKSLEKQGFHFTTESDTEVLLSAWSHYGLKCLDLFDGMFAFALFDGQVTHLVTDPFGEKPLYIAENDEGIYYASEPAPLVDLLGLKFEPNESELAAFLTLGFIPAPATGYRNLQILEPGSHLVVSNGKIARNSRYWTPDRPEIPSGKFRQISKFELDTVADALIDSVRIRLRSDVPMATFLSSGVDSALVAAIAEKELNVKVPAITVGFPDSPVADESEGATLIAKSLGIEHQVIQSDGTSDQNPLSQLISLYGCPIDNATAIPAFDMARLARSSATVALSGIGSDEIFYGYNKYQLFFRHQRLMSLRGPIRSAARWLLTLNGRTTGADLLRHTSQWSYANFKNVGMWDALDQISGMHSWGDEFFSRQSSPAYIEARHFDLTHVMPSSYISAIERSSMRVGLEVRTPYLNRKILGIVDGLDPRSMIGFGQKSIIRRILSRYLPDELVFSGKHGFNSPVEPIIESQSTVPQIDGISGVVADIAMDRRFSGRGRDLFMRMLILSQLTGQGTSQK
jgi:asparagine synthase (glutamine-hydrolysing)